MKNFIAYNKKAKLYAISIDSHTGFPLNRKTSANEPYVKKNLSQYAFPLDNIGGDLYCVPDFQCCVVYEQGGKKPAETDKIIEVYGENIKKVAP